MMMVTKNMGVILPLCRLLLREKLCLDLLDAAFAIWPEHLATGVQKG
jgi:hypothetical protein